MKRTWSILTLLVLSLPAFAAAPTLKQNMKTMGSIYKVIKASMADRGQNEANAKNAEQMIALLTTISTQIPDSITSLPAPAQPAAIADFQRLIDAEKQFATDLQAAFTAGDNTTAAGIVNKMDLDKKEGHDKYNKD